MNSLYFTPHTTSCPTLAVTAETYANNWYKNTFFCACSKVSKIQKRERQLPNNCNYNKKKISFSRQTMILIFHTPILKENVKC